MKPGKKIQKNLERRQRGRQRIIDDNKHKSTFKPEAYRVPGSRSSKK